MTALFCLCAMTLASAQAQIGNAPANYSKIKFTYRQQPRLGIDEKRFFGSPDVIGSTQFKDKMKLETVGGRELAYVPLDVLTEKDKDIIIGLFSHQSFLITGIYNKEKQVTKLRYSRPDEKTDAVRATLKKVFGRTYGPNVNKSIEFNFRKRKKHFESGMVSGDVPISVQDNALRLDAIATQGFFDEEINRTLVTNTAFTDEKLAAYISPVLPFSNAGGVKKIESHNYTIELVSVTYE